MLRMLLPLLLLLATTAWGQVEAPAVTTAQVDAAIEEVSTNLAADDPQREVLLQLYRETRAALESFGQYQQTFKTYSQARAGAAGEIQTIQQALVKTQDKEAPDQADAVESDVELPGDADVDERDCGQEHGHEEGEDADPGFQERVDEQGPLTPIDEASEIGPAQREPGEERRQDRARRECGGSEDQGEHAHPNDFVHQATRAREEEQHQNRQSDAGCRLEGVGFL